MKNKLLFLLSLSLLLSCASAQAQSAATFIDQMQPLIDNTVGGLAIGGPSQQKLAQTVTVAHAGRLRGVFLPIGCDSGRLLVEIRNVNPSGEPGSLVLARQRFPAEDVAVIGPVFRYFKFEDSDLSFMAGNHFAIVLRNPTGSCGIFRGPAGNSYTGGAGFFDALPNAPGWLPLSGPDLDLPFMTVMKLH